jgi:hypothetical protein
MKNPISLSDKTAAEVAKLAAVFGESNSECVERILARFAFGPIAYEPNVIISEEVEQIVCENRSKAAAMAKRLEAFASETQKNDPSERSVRASVVRYSDGWGVEAVVA